MRNWDVPHIVVTDKLRSYDVALREDFPSADHRPHKELNNRAEASHRHTRRREKIMARFKSSGHAQRFLSVHDQIATVLRPKRHLNYLPDPTAIPEPTLYPSGPTMLPAS